MPDENPQPPDGVNAAHNVNPGIDPLNPVAGTGGGGPGATEAGMPTILALLLYLILFTVFVIYCLVKVWPFPTPSGQNPPTASAAATASVTPIPNSQRTATPTPVPTATSTPLPRPTAPATAVSATQTPSPAAASTPSPSPKSQPSPVDILFLPTFYIWEEQQLLLLVILAGALGTLVHSLRSVYWYIGNRSLVKSWIAMYFMLPFSGAALALVFYLVVRGGFFSPQSSFQQTSPFGFAAFAALIGMFSSQAVLKLKEVAEVLLSKPLGGANAHPQGMANPSTTVTPNKPPPPPAGGNPPAQQ
jgi:hypothetical protein